MNEWKNLKVGNWIVFEDQNGKVKFDIKLDEETGYITENQDIIVILEELIKLREKVEELIEKIKNLERNK